MPQRLTAGEAAEECGVSRQTIQSWYNEGLTRKPTIRELIRFLAKREGYAPGSERERLMRAQAEAFELKNAQSRRELCTVAFIEELLLGMAADISGRLDGLPGRMANELAGISDPAIVRARLLEETRGIRAGVAEYAGKLAESAPADPDDGDDMEPAAAEEREPVGGREPGSTTRKRRARAIRQPKDTVPHAAKRGRQKLPANHRDHGVADGEDGGPSKRHRSKTR